MRFAIIPAILAMAACSTTPPVAQVAKPEDDPRVGEKVGQICFQQTINGFSEWDAGEGLILRRGANRQFLVTFSGVCTALDFPRRVGFGPDPSTAGCVRPSDRLYISDDTTRRFGNSYCLIDDIYEFDRSGEAPKTEE